MNPQSGPLIKHLKASEIKPCIFVNERSEITAIKKMIAEGNEEIRDIELEGESTDLIKYYLNEATNLIQSNPNFKYMITVNGKAWKFIRVNSEVMQHFLLVLYYAQAMLAFKFRSEDIG